MPFNFMPTPQRFKDATMLSDSLQQEFPRRGSGGSKASNIKSKGFLGSSAPEKMQGIGNMMSSAKSIFGRNQAPNAMGGSPYTPSFTPNVNAGQTFNPPSQNVGGSFLGRFNNPIAQQNVMQNSGGGFNMGGMGIGNGLWNPGMMGNPQLQNIETGEARQLPSMGGGGFNFPNFPGIRF